MDAIWTKFISSSPKILKIGNIHVTKSKNGLTHLFKDLHKEGRQLSSFMKMRMITGSWRRRNWRKDIGLTTTTNMMLTDILTTLLAIKICLKIGP